MSISYLEWMMRRCVCFFAVIPRRKDSPFYDCSPYQVFENSLAIRATKPRLIFVERGLNETIFGVRPGEVCSFRRREEWLKQDKSKFEKFAEHLSQKVHIPTIEDLGLTKPVALLVDSTYGEAYTPDVINEIQIIIRKQNYSCQIKNPANLERNFLFLHELENCSVLISEVRLPYISPDIMGLIHG